MPGGSSCIALFVKPPVPGRVKTRLARAIGNDAACTLYSALVDRVLATITASGMPLVIFHDGDDAGHLPVAWQEVANSCIPQQGIDLGQRMAHAFSRLFSDGIEQAVLIGSDIPGLDAAYLHNAFRLLAGHDLVIGPAIDGGYCLIGFHSATFTPALFQQIPWSTGQVLALTLAAAETIGLSIGTLPPLRDLDTVDDLHALVAGGLMPEKLIKATEMFLLPA